MGVVKPLVHDRSEGLTHARRYQDPQNDISVIDTPA